MHPFHDYLCGQLDDMLKKRGIVVFYDPRREFEPLFDRELKEIGTGYDGLPRVFVKDRLAFVARHQGSFFALRNAVEPIADLDKPEPLIVYLPGIERDRQASALMELEKSGTPYEPQLKRLALNVLRKRFTDGQIDEMLRPESVGYDDIVSFFQQGGEGTAASVLRTIFDGAQSEALITLWLADEEKDETIVQRDATVELFKLVESRLGLPILDDTSVPDARDKVLRYVLVGEFRSDLGCDPPRSVAMVPEPPTREHVERLRDVARTLRQGYSERYVELAVKVESDLDLANADIDASHLGKIDTFQFEERALLAYAGRLIGGGAYKDALEVIEGRGASFWVDRDVARQAQWAACRHMAELGLAVDEVLPQVTKLASKTGAAPARWVTAYAEQPGGWARVDLLQRRMESWVAKMEDELQADAEAGLGVVRRRHEDLLKVMAKGFSRSLAEAGWTVPSVLHQTKIYPEHVEAAPGRVAYFFVDAMRFEMGIELAATLSSREDVTLRPAVAALPSITPIGMAALLPGAAASFSVVEHKGKLASRIGSTILPALAERMKHLKAERPDARDIDLGELLQGTLKGLKRKLEPVKLLVVRSQAIDGLGEMDGGLLARQIMDTIVGNVARAVRRLEKLGFDTFVVTSDHGHQFSVRKGEDMHMDKPGGNKVDQHRRCWAGHGGQTPGACVRASGAELGYDTDLDFIFPEGLAVFKAGGDLAFHHGGISLQEMVVPVVTLRAAAAAEEPEGREVRLAGVPETITNRTFGVKVAVMGGLFEGDTPLRVSLISDGNEVGAAGMALDAKLDPATGILHVPPRTEATVGLMLKRDDCKTLRVVVQDPTSDAVLAQSEELPVKLGI